MKKIFPYFLPIFGILLLLWINLPVAIPIQFDYGALKIDTTLQRPQLTIKQDNGRIIVRDFALVQGLDLQGGTRLVFEADTKAVSSADIEPALESARDIIERRVNLFGIAEPSVQTVKSGEVYRIAVDLPGVENATDAVDLIGSTAQLTFREQATQSAQIATDGAMIPQFLEESLLDGGDVKKASLVFSQETSEPLVQLEFTKEGTKIFADITRRNVGRPVAIFLDDIFLSAPVVQQPILDGTAVISGQFTVEAAKELSVAINSGALPLPIVMVEQTSVGPSLGVQEVTLSLFAGIVGLIMVMLFMILYYRKLGVIACAALLIYGLITLAIFRLIPIVLTLPGIAGFILSIGMAVDANILIFERIKDEQRKGRAFDSAIKVGFGRAMDAIKDANITTLLVAFILFNPLNWEFLPQFGLVRGFALTLAIGVIISLFTGVFITKRLITTFYKLP